MRLALGTQGWFYRDWEGALYPRGTPAAQYLREYAREFRSVEIDSTFYGTPAPERLVRWAQAVPPDFTFSLKLAREITHERRLVGCDKEAAAFFDAAAVLGSRLEAILVQLPPDFGPDERDVLAAFVRSLPSGPRIAVEVRDPRWFAAGARADLLGMLRERGIALAVSDGTLVELNLMLAAFAVPTATFGYIRWLGRRDAVSRFDKVVIDRGAHIERWSAALAAAGTRLERVCGYANNHYMGHGPATVRALYRALGIEHVPPVRVEQTELFPELNS
jgi:uncharacterized protein YecE (DUF72 family)